MLLELMNLNLLLYLSLSPRFRGSRWMNPSLRKTTAMIIKMKMMNQN